MSELTTLQTLQSDFQYRGNFETAAIDLVPQLLQLIKNFLRELGPFGLDLRGMRLDGSALSEVHLRLNIPEMNFTCRALLDRLEVNFWKLQEIGADSAKKMLAANWAAVHETEPSINVRLHLAWLNIYARPIGSSSYSSMMERFVKLPPAFGDKLDAGVGFYSQGDRAKGVLASSFVIDRWTAVEQGLSLKLAAEFDGTRIPPEEVAGLVEELLKRYIDSLGLAFEQVK